MNEDEKTAQEILALKMKMKQKMSKIKDKDILSKLKVHGGKRERSGRKPIEDRKKQVQFSLRESTIETIGLEKVREIALQAVEKEYAKIILEKD